MLFASWHHCVCISAVHLHAWARKNNIIIAESDLAGVIQPELWLGELYLHFKEGFPQNCARSEVMFDKRRVRAQTNRVRAPSTCFPFLGIVLLKRNWRAFKHTLESIWWTPSSDSDDVPPLLFRPHGTGFRAWKLVLPGITAMPRLGWCSCRPWGRRYWTGDVWALSPSFQETPANVLWGSAAAARTVRPRVSLAVPAGQTIGLLSSDNHRWGRLTKQDF